MARAYVSMETGQRESTYSAAMTINSEMVHRTWGGDRRGAVHYSVSACGYRMEIVDALRGQGHKQRGTNN